MDNLYRFFWHEYCDWYLELIKPRLYGNDPEAKAFAMGIGLYIMRGLVRLFHPFVPFITEEIWHHVKLENESDLITAPWPDSENNYFDDNAEAEMESIQALIGAIRNIRGEMNVPPNKKARVFIKCQETDFIGKNEIYIKSLAQVEAIEAGPNILKPRSSASAVIKNMEIFIPLEGLIDIQLEKNRLEKEALRLETQIEATKHKLFNKDFIKKAPKEVIDREKKKSQDFHDHLDKIRSILSGLNEASS